MLFLVPFAVPAHAAGNASLPTVKTTPTLVLQETPTALTEAVTNPSTNAYTITAITFIAPSGWNFTNGSNGALTTGAVDFCTAGSFFNTIAVSLTAIQCSAIGSGATGLPPGFTAMLTGSGVSIQGPSSPKSAAPVTGSFTTSVVDASGSGAYPGPQWTETSIAANGGVASHTTGETPPTIVVTGLQTSYTAGSAAFSVTATLTSPSQPGVPVTFSPSVGTYPSSGFTTSFSPSTGTTSSSGAVSSSWQPSNKLGDSSGVTATIAGSAYSGNSAASTPAATTTAAGLPCEGHLLP